MDEAKASVVTLAFRADVTTWHVVFSLRATKLSRYYVPPPKVVVKVHVVDVSL